MEKKSSLIPIIIDVERNIDGINMIRCSYFSIQSDNPIPNWTLSTNGFSSPMLILNLEAILIGSPQNPDNFRNEHDIDLMYDFIENQEELFIDLNDIWIPSNWFNTKELKQGFLFRIPQDTFSLCWKLRNDIISTDDFLEIGNENIKNENYSIRFSQEESHAFRLWTDNQIKHSQEIYQGNRDKYLQKIKQ